MTGRVVPSRPLRSGRAPLNLTLRRASPATLPGAVAALRQSDGHKKYFLWRRSHENVRSSVGRGAAYCTMVGGRQCPPMILIKRSRNGERKFDQEERPSGQGLYIGHRSSSPSPPRSSSLGHFNCSSCSQEDSSVALRMSPEAVLITWKVMNRLRSIIRSSAYPTNDLRNSTRAMGFFFHVVGRRWAHACRM